MLKKFYDLEEKSLATRSDTMKKLETRSDAIIKTLDSEETPAHTVSGANRIAKLWKRVSASVRVISIESLTYNSIAMRGYVLAEFNTKNVWIEESDGVLKQWILVNNNPKKIWRIKLLAWNKVAKKIARQLPKGKCVLISNFLVKDRFRHDDSGCGQSPYEIPFTNRTTLTTIG